MARTEGREKLAYGLENLTLPDLNRKHKKRNGEDEEVNSQGQRRGPAESS